MIKVSVVVPVYNAENYIKKCIDSLVNQTYKDIEIIIVNDGSTDNSLEVIRKFDDERIKIIHQQNSGVYLARKKGIETATGEYIMFVDSDDWIEITAIEILINYITMFDAEIVKFREIGEPDKKKSPLIIENNTTPYIVNSDKKTDLYKMLITTYKLNRLTDEIVKKELIECERIDRRLNQGEDALVNYEIFTNAKKILIISDLLYHYNKNPNSTTNILELKKISQNINDVFYVYKRKVEYIKKWNCYNNSTIKELGLGLVNFIAGELLKIYRIENLDYKEVEKFYNDIYANSMFKDFTSNINPKDIKDKNYIKKRMKINLITKNYKKTYKYYRYIIKISYKIKERLKKR